MPVPVTNKQRDKIKVLYWDKTGFALTNASKKPSTSGHQKKNEVFTLTPFELDRLLSGFTIIGRKPVQINDFTMTYHNKALSTSINGVALV